MLLSNILITSPEGQEDVGLPPIIEQNIESLKRHHPDLTHKLFGEDDLIAFLEQHFPSEVLAAYSAFQPYAYRADLARYCILYEYGGLYADLSYFFVRPIPMSADKPVVFRGNLVASTWDASNGLIYAPPKHKALERAIELVCANAKKNYYGKNGFCPTGPTLFGKALAQTCEADELNTGFAKMLSRRLVRKLAPNVDLPESALIHCQFADRQLVAIKRKSPTSPGLIEMGITSGNLYRSLWEEGKVYSEPWWPPVSTPGSGDNPDSSPI